MDDSGFFSVQVISEALKIWSLELVPLLSRTDDVALSAQRDPTLVKKNLFTINICLKFIQNVPMHCLCGLVLEKLIYVIFVNIGLQYVKLVISGLI